MGIAGRKDDVDRASMFGGCEAVLAYVRGSLVSVTSCDSPWACAPSSPPPARRASLVLAPLSGRVPSSLSCAAVGVDWPASEGNLLLPMDL